MIWPPTVNVDRSEWDLKNLFDSFNYSETSYLTWKQSLKSYKPDVTYCKGIFGNGLKIEDDWKERRERERQTCTQERILERLKPEKKAIFFCIVGNEAKSRTYLKISCCVAGRFFSYLICKQTALISGSKLCRPSI